MKKNILWKGQPLKFLTFGIRNKGGRNSFGRICSFKKGTRFKRKYRIIDFKRQLFDIPGIVRRIEYDPNRTAYIALICYKNGILSYIISIEGLNIGDEIINYSKKKKKEEINLSKGNKLYLHQIPEGSIISNIELIEGNGAQLCRSAGSCGVLLNRYNYIGGIFLYSLIRLSSGVEYLISNNCTAVIGSVSNNQYFLKELTKAGTSRNKGKKPTVRGVAMNPIDHPHGGGEGKKGSNVIAKSPWGKKSKGIKTRKKFRKNKFILTNRFNKMNK